MTTKVSKRNPYIHGLRGILSAGILLFHVGNSGLPTFTGEWYTPIKELIESFNFCVQLFFALSGIVILYAYQKSDTSVGFLIDRATRILPVLWATIGVILIGSYFAPAKNIPSDAMNIIANVFALPTLWSDRLINPAAWTLSYEFCFYGLFVVFGVFHQRVNTRKAFLLTLFLGLVLVQMHPVAVCFLIGLYISLQKNPYKTLVKYWWCDGGLTMLLSFLAWRACHLLDGDPQKSLIAVFGNATTLFYFLAACMLTYIGLKQITLGLGHFSQFLTTPVMQWLGTISYSLYLWQAIVMGPLKKAFYAFGIPALSGSWTQLFYLLLLIPPTLAIAHVSQRYLEVYVTNALRKKLIRPPHKAAVIEP